MSDFFENENNTAEGNTPAADTEANAEAKEYVDEFAGFDTIFSDPAEHKSKAPKGGGKKRILAVIASLLVVAILAGGTVAVIKLIPEKEDETSSDTSPFETIEVLNLETDNISRVTVTNSKGSFTLLSEKVVSETESSTDSSSSDTSSTETATETVWYVDGVDKALVSSSSISSIVSAAAVVDASREITTMTATECGLDTPVYKADIVYSEGEVSLLVGDNSLDGTGTYIKLSNSDTVYLSDSADFSGLEFELLDLADTTAIPAASFTGDISAYTDDEGTLTSFDYVTISGKNFPETVKIVPDNSGSELSEYIGYYVETPINRPANNVDKLLSLFASGVTVSGAYSFDVSASSLAAVGLNNPDIVITLSVAGQNKTFKLSKASDGNYAVITDGSVMIKMVSASSLELAGYTTEDYYSTWVMMQSINELSNFKLSTGGTDYSFDIKYDNSEEAEETYVITYGGEKITAEYFQDFYQIFVALQCSDFTTEKLTAAPECTITLTLSADGSARTLEFTKATATKYQYSIDGVPMGRITSSSYNKLIKNLKLVAENKPVE